MGLVKIRRKAARWVIWAAAVVLIADAVAATVVVRLVVVDSADAAARILKQLKSGADFAVLAREHNVPFYVAAPISTLDLTIPSGEHIPIEQRAAEEVPHFRGVRIAPDVEVGNPAFDVTPARFIAAIITERGVARAPYVDSLRKLAAG